MVSPSRTLSGPQAGYAVGAPKSRPEPGIESVRRALLVLECMNRRAWSSVEQLYQDTALPKPTLVRILKTLVGAGYAARDSRQNGYRVTQGVQSLSCGFHGDPMVVEAARPWAIALTRELRWPAGVAILDGDGITIRFSTIPDSPISPFHATLNMRLSLFANALGLAYYAFCPELERQRLLAMLGEREGLLLQQRGEGWLAARVVEAQERGYATRDPLTEPQNSGTIAVPIRRGDGVAATLGLTFFKSAVSPRDKAQFVDALKTTAASIEQQMSKLDEV